MSQASDCEIASDDNHGDEVREQPNYDWTVVDAVVPWGCRFLAVNREYRGEEITDEALDKAFDDCCGNNPREWYGVLKKIIPLLDERDSIRKRFDDQIEEIIKKAYESHEIHRNVDRRDLNHDQP